MVLPFTECGLVVMEQSLTAHLTLFSALVKLFKSGMKDLFCYLVAIFAMALCLSGRINNFLIVLMGAAAGLIYMEVKARHDLP